MKNEEMKNFTENIQKKLGKEASALILDDLGLLITDNSQMNDVIKSQNDNIEKQKSLNEKLIATNSSLLQQVGINQNGSQDFNSSFGTPKTEYKKEDVPTKTNVSFFDCFDKKGNFIK